MKWRPFRRPHFIEGALQRLSAVGPPSGGGRFGGRTSLRALPFTAVMHGRGSWRPFRRPHFIEGECGEYDNGRPRDVAAVSAAALH